MSRTPRRWSLFRKPRPAGTRRQPRRYQPEIDLLEKRWLLSLALEMFNPVPAVEMASTGDRLLASFTYDTGLLSEYTATIDWGDGEVTEGTIVAVPGGCDEWENGGKMVALYGVA